MPLRLLLSGGAEIMGFERYLSEEAIEWAVKLTRVSRNISRILGVLLTLRLPLHFITLDCQEELRDAFCSWRRCDLGKPTD